MSIKTAIKAKPKGKVSSTKPRVSSKTEDGSQGAEEKEKPQLSKKPATKARASVGTKPAAKAGKVDPLLKQLLESGAHFGHQTSRWNPKMKTFIFGQRGGVHIIDLIQTADRLKAAQKFVENTTSQGGKVLFVGTKRQAKDLVEATALDAGMPYVAYRWLGGMLTNLDTIKLRVLRMKKLETELNDNELSTMSKKDRGQAQAELEGLKRVFAGITDMDTTPAALFCVDTLREATAITEARKLGVPVIAICDTNSNPELVDYPIPANDDAIKALKLIIEQIGQAAKAGAEEYAKKAATEADKSSDARVGVPTDNVGKDKEAA